MSVSEGARCPDAPHFSCPLCLCIRPVSAGGGEQGGTCGPSRRPFPAPLEAFGKPSIGPQTRTLGPAAWGRSRADPAEGRAAVPKSSAPPRKKPGGGLRPLPDPKAENLAPSPGCPIPQARARAPQSPTPSQAKGPGVPCQPRRERGAGTKGSRTEP